MFPGEARFFFVFFFFLIGNDSQERIGYKVTSGIL